MTWRAITGHIDACRVCESADVPHLHVPRTRKRHPSLTPAKAVRLFFVAIAPPWNGSYFWDDTRPDRLREKLFALVQAATGERVATLARFRDAGYFLAPAVRCPSQINGLDHRPAAQALRHCAQHLENELRVVAPKRVLALGYDAMRSVGLALGFRPPPRMRDTRRKIWPSTLPGSPILVAGTYYAGNNRHRGRNKIVSDIRWILSMAP